MMAKFGRALIADRFEAQQMILEAVEKSSNLAEAMECVGAMYGIPASNILVNDDLKTVKVVNDNIVCPSNVSATGNVNTIVRSIGTVLDQISHRINEKLNNVQMSNVESGRESDEVAARTDPSKGKVVATYKDSNGDTLFVYDSGIIDAPQTPAGRAKADEIRANGNVPAMNPLTKSGPSYFSDEDDVMNGVKDPASQTTVEYCFADMIGESAYFIDAMARFNDTPNLGHAILTYHGYDCVQPTMNFVQEAEVTSKKSLTADDVKYMKFDNSEIIKAVECFNKARANQSYIKHVEDIDPEAFIRDKEYQNGIKHLENQFNCKLAIKWVHAGKDESNVQTLIAPTEYRTKLTVSKSKGFQLGGAPIHVYIIEDGFSELITNRQDLFGQSFTSIMLHEIFHNIAGMMRYENAEFVTTMTVAMDEASRTLDPKLRRMVIEKYVDALNVQMDGKIGRVTKRLLTKRLLALVAAKGDAKMMTQIEDSLDDDSKNNGINEEANNKVNRAIKIYKRAIKDADKPIRQARGKGIAGMIVGGLAIVGSILGVILTSSSFGLVLSIALGLAGGGAIGAGITGFASVHKYKKIMQRYKDTKDMEEYYADLMSGMYQLPQHFFIGMKLGNKRYHFNEIEEETMNEWIKVEKILEECMESSYPSASERTWTGVVIAKKLLKDCPHLDKSIKKYLQWIVENNDKLLKSSISDSGESHSFDPKEAEDLDKHVTSMIKNNKVTVTEAAIKELMDSTEFGEWVMSGMPYTEEEVSFQELCQVMNICDEIYEEFNTSRNVTGYKDESLLKRILMFIPRLITSCLEVIFRFAHGLGQSGLDLIYKIFTGNKVYKLDFDIKTYENALVEAEVEVSKLVTYFQDTKDLNDYLEKIKNMDDEVIAKLQSITTPKFPQSADDKALRLKGALQYKEKFSRFDDFSDVSAFAKPDKVSLLSDNVKFELNGRQICDAIVNIHKTGNRLTPKLRKLLEQAKRLTKKNDTNIESLNVEQKTNFKAMVGMLQSIYRMYNTVESTIWDFKRKAMKKDEVDKETKGEN